MSILRPVILVDDRAFRLGSDEQALRTALADVIRLGGAYRDRTDDLLNANQALSQLS